MDNLSSDRYDLVMVVSLFVILVGVPFAAKGDEAAVWAVGWSALALVGHIWLAGSPV